MSEAIIPPIDLPCDAGRAMSLAQYRVSYVTHGYYCRNCDHYFKLRQHKGVPAPLLVSCFECDNQVQG